MCECEKGGRSTKLSVFFSILVSVDLSAVMLQYSCIEAYWMLTRCVSVEGFFFLLIILKILFVGFVWFGNGENGEELFDLLGLIR